MALVEDGALLGSRQLDMGNSGYKGLLAVFGVRAKGLLIGWEPLYVAMEAGTPGRIRTCDPRFRRPMLYPLSYGRMGQQRGISGCGWGERRDSNPRSPGPQPGALTTWPRSPSYLSNSSTGI